MLLCKNLQYKFSVRVPRKQCGGSTCSISSLAIQRMASVKGFSANRHHPSKGASTKSWWKEHSATVRRHKVCDEWTPWASRGGVGSSTNRRAGTLKHSQTNIYATLRRRSSENKEQIVIIETGCLNIRHYEEKVPSTKIPKSSGCPRQTLDVHSRPLDLEHAHFFLLPMSPVHNQCS